MATGDIRGLKEAAGPVYTEVNLNSEYLKLGQATPQTITGGVPLLASTRVIDGDNQLVDKSYADRVQSGGMKSFFFTKTASDVGGMYKALITLPAGSVQTIVAAATEGEAILAAFITDVYTQPYRVIDGSRFFYVTAKSDNLSRDVQLKGYVYTTDINGANPILLRTSTLSPILTGVDTEYIMSVWGDALLIPITMRIKFVIVSVKTGTGVDPNVTLSVDDDTFSRLDVPSPTGVTDLSGVLALDQTVPQTVINGVPLLSSSRVLNSNNQIVDKLYVDTFHVDINTYGFINQTDTQLSFDGTNLFTLGALNTSWSYYRAGIKYTITGNKTCTLTGTPVTTGLWHIYIDATDGTLSATVSNSGNNYAPGWTLNDTKVPVATIYFNNSLTPKWVMTNERHTCLINRRDHMHEHYTTGTLYSSGGSPGTTYTLNTATAAGNTFGLTTTNIFDEDLYLTLSELVDDNGASANYRLVYRTAANTWVWSDSDMPFMYTGTNPYSYLYYDNNGTMSAVTNRYANYYVVLTNSVASAEAAQGTSTCPCRFSIVPGRVNTNTLSTATSESFASFSLTGFIVNEAVAIWQITFDTQGIANTVKGRCQINRFQRINSNIITSTATISATHNGLSGLQGGTTDEFYHLTLAQAIIATQAATTDVSGYLSTTDWDIFNSKQAALTFGIADTNKVQINGSTASTGEIVKFTTTGIIDATPWTEYTPAYDLVPWYQGAVWAINTAYVVGNKVSMTDNTVGSTFMLLVVCVAAHTSDGSSFWNDYATGKWNIINFVPIAGIANDNFVMIDAADVAVNDYAKFTANGLVGRSYSEVLSDIGAGGGGIIWSAVTSNGNLVADTGTLANKSSLLVLTLPASCAVGKTIRVAGMNAGLWKIAQNASQYIKFGNLTTTVGVGGYLASMLTYDAVELVCIVADLGFTVVSSQGVITII